MKLLRVTEAAKVTIPRAAIAISKLEGTDRLQLHALESAAVLLKDRMTAMEVVKAIDSLDQLAGQLLEALIDACDQCVCCEEDCPFICGDGGISLPSHLLDEANIPEGARLCAVPDPKSGCIIVRENTAEHSIDDVPDGLLDTLLECGVCLESLSGLLASGEAVYGS